MKIKEQQQQDMPEAKLRQPSLNPQSPQEAAPTPFSTLYPFPV